MSERVTVDVNHSTGRHRIALTRVPCVGERIAFRMHDGEQWLYVRANVVGVEHYDADSAGDMGDGADALIGVKDLHE